MSCICSRTRFGICQKSSSESHPRSSRAQRIIDMRQRLAGDALDVHLILRFLPIHIAALRICHVDLRLRKNQRVPCLTLRLGRNPLNLPGLGNASDSVGNSLENGRRLCQPSGGRCNHSPAIDLTPLGNRATQATACERMICSCSSNSASPPSANPNTQTEQHHQSQQTQRSPDTNPPHPPQQTTSRKNPPNHQPPITKPSNTLKIRQSTRHNPHAKPNQTQPPPTTDQPPRLCVSRCKSTILTGPPMRYAQN